MDLFMSGTTHYVKSIANNTEIDVIWDQFQQKLEPLREKLNAALNQSWQEWEIPVKLIPNGLNCKNTALIGGRHESLGKEIDASIAAKADFEYLYDKPYEDKKKVRVAGHLQWRASHPTDLGLMKMMK